MKNLLTFAFASLPIGIFAHGGHSHFDPATLIHYVATPEHAVPLAGFALVAGWLFYRSRRVTSNK